VSCVAVWGYDPRVAGRLVPWRVIHSVRSRNEQLWTHSPDCWAGRLAVWPRLCWTQEGHHSCGM